MKSSLVTIVAVVFATLILTQVYAQSQGVGAFLNLTQGDVTVNLIDWKTAPRSEIIIQNSQGDVQAIAKIGATGQFTLSFKTDAVSNNDLYIHAVDDSSATSPIKIDGQDVIGVLLPPTIHRNSDNGNVTVAQLTGFSFPGSEITLEVTTEADSPRLSSGEAGGTKKMLQTTAEAGTGKWVIDVADLTDGRYAARASALSQGVASAPSQTITFVMSGVAVTKITSAAAKVLVIPALASAAAPAAAAGGVSLGNLYYYLVRFGIALRGFFFFRRKKRRSWGVVYDAVTKHPVTGAIVRLFRGESELLETEVTSSLGAFSFLPEPGKYTIRATKPGFLFPSLMVQGNVDGEYGSVYHGELFGVADYSSTINLSVPLDPKAYDRVERWQKLKVFFRQYGAFIELLVLVAGLVVSLVAFYGDRSILNQIIIAFYGVLLFFGASRFIRLKREWGIVVDETGAPVPLVSLSLLDSTFNRSVQRRLSDAVGRYRFVAPQGAYSILVSSDAWELAAGKGRYNGEPITVKRDGQLITVKIVVRKKGLSLSSLPGREG